MARRTKIAITGADLSSAAMRRRVGAAGDDALLFHRAAHMPRHFSDDAYGLYPAAYPQRKPPRSQLFASLGVIGQPLVHTGRLKAAVTTGEYTLTGPHARRAINWNSLPHYTYFNPVTVSASGKHKFARRAAAKPQYIHKVKALEAINAAEGEALSDRMARHVDQQLAHDDQSATPAT